jgi:thiol-disulfide isomerase/thioredoxin
MKKYLLSIMMAAVAMCSCADNSKRQLAEAETDSAEATVETAGVEGDGTMAPDFTLNDLDGKPLSLSSLRGKYVILDFWGSWCGWCIKGIPLMKEYYQKYAGKFEILGIDCNDPERKWKAAVEKYGLPWLHVYNPRESDLLDLYDIEGFPTKIIIGPDGRIVKIIEGESPAFYTFLDQLFGQ